MKHPSARTDFLAGAARSVPVFVSSAPFGLLFGALAVENGMTVGEATLMSTVVFAGASQMVGLELFGKQVAPWLIVLSIFAVNFRHVLYSAALGPRLSHWPVWKQALGFFFLTDPQYAESEKRVEARLSVPFAWYMGLALPIFVFWVLNSFLGAFFGRMIGDLQSFGVDFLLPIYFLGLVMDFRDRPRWLPVVAVSAIVSVLAELYVGSPWHVSIGALAGVALAAMLPVKPSGEVIDPAPTARVTT
ncbi:MAG: AzlC family ABC transporter permease [Rhizobiaceae bacterium]|nr:AzlC family ABC transporter permease [Rhizobiaceae bacterium]MCV0406577.1 AzlC family ABC transporter permease [Rhizobiaceae bacterium]